MTTPQEPRWYSVNNIGMATLCADKADAEDVARTCDIDFPRQSPHRAVQLVELSALEAERTARIEAQQRLADMQDLAAKSGLAHRMAVQRCVQTAVAEAVAAERAALRETLGEADVLAVNFMRVAGIDKHAARQCADVVRELVAERTARIEARQRLADAQELAAKAGLAHMKAVADAVAENEAAEREACEERVVSLFEVLETPYLPDITRAIRARGTP